MDINSSENLYLCQKARDNIGHLIKVDEFDTEYIKVFDTKNFTIDETPHIHHNVNIIGLMALNYLGFIIADGEFAFNVLRAGGITSLSEAKTDYFYNVQIL